MRGDARGVRDQSSAIRLRRERRRAAAMCPGPMLDDKRSDALDDGFECDERDKAGQRRRGRGTCRAAEVQTHLTMSDRALCRPLVNVRGVHGHSEGERQRQGGDQDSGNPRKAQPVAIAQHPARLVPCTLRRNSVATCLQLLAQLHGQAITWVSLRPSHHA